MLTGPATVGDNRCLRWRVGLFICSCNALSDRDIKAKALACNGTVVDCYRLLGTAPVCGTCMSNAKRIIDDARARAGAAPKAAASSRPVVHRPG